MIIKINKEKIIDYDEATNRAVVYSVADVAREALEAKTKLGSVPEIPSDKELLEWAKKNYPMPDYTAEKEYLNQKIALDEAIKKLK